MSDDPKRLAEPGSPASAALRDLLRAAAPPPPTVDDEEAVEAAVNATVTALAAARERANGTDGG